MQKDFKTFRWLDLITMGGVNLLPTFCLIYAIYYGISGQPLFMLSLVAACFWGIYGLWLYQRKQYIDKITFITKHQIAVIANGFEVKQSDIESLTDETIQKWNTACNFDRSAKSLEGLWVEFRTFPVDPHRTFGTLSGFTIGNNSVIGWKADLKTTAFQHEIGHTIHHEFTGEWSNDGCHEFMAKYSLP